MTAIYILTRVAQIEDMCGSPVVGMYKTCAEAEGEARIRLGRDYTLYRKNYTLRMETWYNEGCPSMELILDDTWAIRYHVTPMKVLM